jgi:glycosyltransferase involved in cell wall biosynthesis
MSMLADLPWRLLIAGAGPAESDVRRAFASLEPRIHWFGMLDRSTLHRLYRCADLYLWPAVKEAWGMALLEAQASGLPVVAGRSGGVPAIVADGVTGLLVEPANAGQFAAALRSLLADPERREKMSAAAWAKAERDHDIAAAATLLDEHIRAALPPASG